MVNSGDINQAWILSSPGALGDLGSHQFPSWPSPQSVLSPVNGECLSCSHPGDLKSQRSEELLASGPAGRPGTPVRAVRGRHQAAAYLEGPLALQTPSSDGASGPLLPPLPPDLHTLGIGCHPPGHLASF